MKKIAWAAAAIVVVAVNVYLAHRMGIWYFIAFH